MFCHVDDFCQTFRVLIPKKSLPGEKLGRNRILDMTDSEIMTVLIWFHSSHYRDIKAYYLEHVCVVLAGDFPNLPS